MTKLHLISLNSQFTVVLNGIICFSVRLCENSLLVLKMPVQVFTFASKNVQGFSSERKTLMSLLSVLFHRQNRVSVFWNFKFWPGYMGKRSLCPWNQPHFLRNSDKSLMSRTKQFKRTLRHGFADERQLKINVKIKVFPNLPFTFLLFKASAFL